MKYSVERSFKTGRAKWYGAARTYEATSTYEAAQRRVDELPERTTPCESVRVTPLDRTQIFDVVTETFIRLRDKE